MISKMQEQVMIDLIKKFEVDLEGRSKRSFNDAPQPHCNLDLNLVKVIPLQPLSAKSEDMPLTTSSGLYEVSN